MVLRPDRRELLLYLDGEIETTANIDKNAPLEITIQRPLPYVKHSSTTTSTASAVSSSLTSGIGLSIAPLPAVGSLLAPIASTATTQGVLASSSLKRPLPTSSLQLNDSPSEMMQVDQDVNTSGKVARVGAGEQTTSSDSSGKPIDSANSLIGISLCVRNTGI